MSIEENEDNTIYKVLVDHENQYSIWPADRENALGWSDAGKTGTRQECLEYIEAAAAGKRRGPREEKGRKADDGGGGVRGDL